MNPQTKIRPLKVQELSEISFNISQTLSELFRPLDKNVN